MTDNGERRAGPDRRRLPRGGRRQVDVEGYAPLVAVIEQDSKGREATEAILATLRFAVAPFDSLEKALFVMNALRPDVIVATEDHVKPLRDRAPSNRLGGRIPIVPLTEDTRTPDALVAAVRRALRDDAS